MKLSIALTAITVTFFSPSVTWSQPPPNEPTVITIQNKDKGATESESGGAPPTIGTDDSSAEEGFAQGIMGTDIIPSGEFFTMGDKIVINYQWDATHGKIQLSIPEAERWPFPPDGVSTVPGYAKKYMWVNWFQVGGGALGTVTKADLANIGTNAFAGPWGWFQAPFSINKPKAGVPGGQPYYLFEYEPDACTSSSPTCNYGIIQPIGVDADNHLTINWWITTKPVSGFPNLPTPPPPTS